MNEARNIHFSESTFVFHERRLPARAQPAGYAALIDAYSLRVPLPRTLAAIGEKHKLIRQSGWQILSPRHAPEPSLAGHLTFALKNEGLDLAVLKKLFERVGASAVEEVVREKPSGSYARRIWSLYEWLLGDTLDLPAITNPRPLIIKQQDKVGQFEGAAANDGPHARAGCGSVRVSRQRVMLSPQSARRS